MEKKELTKTEETKRNRSEERIRNKNASNKERPKKRRRPQPTYDFEYEKLDDIIETSPVEEPEEDPAESEALRRRQDPWRRESARRNRRASAGKKRRGAGIGVFVAFAFLILVFVGVLAIGRDLLDEINFDLPTGQAAIEPTADLNFYFGTRGAHDLAIIMNREVLRGDTGGTGGRILNGEVYLDLALINREFNGRFYWDSIEQLLIHTLPYGSVVVSPETREYTSHGEPRSENFDIIRMEGGTPFVALAFIQRFANLDYTLYENPQRLVVTTQWGERSVTTMSSDAALRWLAGPESDILTGVTRGQDVFFIEEEGDWRKIATFDGFIGYVLATEIGEIRQETFNRSFSEPVFTRIIRPGPLNVTWDDMHDSTTIGEALARAQGLTAVAPMWLSIADIYGNIDSTASIEYVQVAHQAGVEVWVTLRDFHGGISSYNETYAVLSRTSSRRQIIEQTVAETLRVGADGINLDLELVPFEAGAHFVQFVREMSVETRNSGLVLSVANFYPLEWRLFMNLAEQARVVDYIMLMGYDQHYEGGRTAGPVASFEFVREGIELALRQVPADMLINALPFYARLWYEVPMTEEEMATGDGYTTHVSSIALALDLSMAVMLNSGVEMVWDPVARMYYAEWEDPYGNFRWWLQGMGVNTEGLFYPSGGTYRMWLEDERSLREKLQIMSDMNLAGVASWQLWFDNVEVWELIGEFY